MNMFDLCALDGARVVKMDNGFFTGYRKTIVKPQEVLLSIEIPYSKKVKITMITYFL